MADAVDKAEVGARIRQLLGERLMPQSELAERVGIKPHTLWRQLRGEFLARPETLEQIARELDTTTQYLLYGQQPGITPRFPNFWAWAATHADLTVVELKAISELPFRVQKPAEAPSTWRYDGVLALLRVTG